MKKYHVYGVGNALVDMEFEVSDEWLSKMGVTKGVMTLVDDEKQRELLGKLDVFKANKCCGGSAANTIIAVSQLGGDTFYSCKVASDDVGEFYYEDLMSEGVHTNLGDSRPDGVTGKCLVMVTPDAERTMNTFLGITASMGTSELCEEEIKNSEYVYLEGYLVTSPTGKSAAIKAREIAQANDVKVAFTFSDPGIVNFFKEGLIDIMGDKKIDLVFCNEEEAKEFCAQTDVNEAIKTLSTYAHTVVITRGEKGAMVYTNQEVMEVPTRKVKPVDSNGAGDLFAGSFLYAITHGRNLEEAARLACAASSKLVTQFGARLKKEELLEIKTQELN
ncbi:MAG: adenosine kinase [Bdellovibrionales bacterium]|jgi:sugar/nucleoside kinase (ribokinase family)|nr:adenosine kinase [Bdellovibrionales bacterium]